MINFLKRQEDFIFTFEEFTECFPEEDKKVMLKIMPFEKATQKEIYKKFDLLSIEEQDILMEILHREMKKSDGARKKEISRKVKEVIRYIILGSAIGTLLFILYTLGGNK